MTIKFHSPLTTQEAERRKRAAGNAVVPDGGYVHFDIMLRDAATQSSSIDQAFQELIAKLAKKQGMKASEYLATLGQRELERLIQGVASEFIAKAGAAGIAKALSVDSAPFKAAIDWRHAQHDARYAELGSHAPKFDRDRERFLMDAAIKNGLRAIAPSMIKSMQTVRMSKSDSAALSSAGLASSAHDNFRVAALARTARYR